MKTTGIATAFVTAMAFTGASLAGPAFAQNLQFGTAVGNPGESTYSGLKSLSTGRGTDTGETTQSITPVHQCWETKDGIEQCEFYLIWCPQPGEECIEVH